MPIQLTPIPKNDLMHGYVWTMADEEKLARLVAKILLGHYLHVERILSGRTPKNFAAEHPAAKEAKLRLKVEQGKDPWHRDGLLFQAISWIAAHKAAHGTKSIFSLPHQIPAHKGFDGLQLELNHSGKACGLVIFEDKATENPRATIQAEVWPAIELLDSGRRQNELMQETTALLQRAHISEPDEIVATIVWKQLRKFRVSITGAPGHDSHPGIGQLFKGYDSVAPGKDTAKRRAEVICFVDLRRWMDKFAKQVCRAIDEESKK
jgi:hypothetical protein